MDTKKSNNRKGATEKKRAGDKRIIISLLFLVIVFSSVLFGCGSAKNIEDAAAKANKTVEKWNNDSSFDRYNGYYDSEMNTYFLEVYSAEFTLEKWKQILDIQRKNNYGRWLLDDYDKYYEALKKDFANFPDTDIVVGRFDPEKNLVIMFKNGEQINWKWEIKMKKRIIFLGMIALSMICLVGCGETASQKTQRLQNAADQAQKAARDSLQRYNDLVQGIDELNRLQEQLDNAKWYQD